MTHPRENTFYVTLTSQTTKEFPNNSPTKFHYRLPQSLWLQGQWKVGLASVFFTRPFQSPPARGVISCQFLSDHSFIIIPPLLRQQRTLFVFARYITCTEEVLLIFYFNNMPKRSTLANLENFCPNLTPRICKMPPMALILCPRFFGGWHRI